MDEITLLDIYNAVECVKDGQLFHFHANPNQLCPVGRNMHTLLDERLENIQKAMEKEMSSISMQDIINDAEKNWVVSRIMHKIVCRFLNRMHSASKVDLRRAASRCFMFMYFLLPQWVPAA